MKYSLVLFALALPAFAQEQDVQRALIQRDQQSAEFALRVRQSQEVDTSNNLLERQQMENQSARQLQRLEKDLPQELRPYERQRASDERLLLFAPPAVRTQPPPKPRPLPAGVQHIVTPVAPAH